MNSKSNPFELNALDTTAAFIDGPSLYWAYKALDSEYQIDMMRLKGLIADNSRLQSIGYYTVFPPKERRGENGHTPLKPLTDMLGYNGFRVITKDAYSYPTDLGMRTKGSISMELAIDALNSAHQGINHVLLFLSDDDYTPLIPIIQDRGSRVTVVSTEKNSIVAGDLVWQADKFVDIETIEDLISRKSR